MYGGAEAAFTLGMITKFEQAKFCILVILQCSVKVRPLYCPPFRRSASYKKAKFAIYSVYGVYPLRAVPHPKETFQTF